MFEFLQPTGADAGIYLSYAAECVRGGQCWREIRPLGYILYLALPLRMGWAAESIIIMNLLSMALSSLLGVLALDAVAPLQVARASWAWAGRVVMVAMAHLVFMLGCAHYALSDVPAACAALGAVWLFILAVHEDRVWLYPLAGLSLGLAVALRAFYLYPAAYFVAGAALTALLGRRISVSALVGFVLFAAAPISAQYAVTYAHTGSWSFLEPKASAFYQKAEMDAVAYSGGNISGQPIYGADPVQDQMVWYDCTGCFNGPGGWDAALKRFDLAGIIHLAWKRNAFYLGSWAYQPVLKDLKDRLRSPLIWLLNAFALGLALSMAFRRGLGWTLAAPVIFIGAVWGLATLIHPESRFMMGTLTLAWVLGPVAWVSQWASRDAVAKGGL